MKRIKTLLLASMVVLGLTAGVLAPATGHALDPKNQIQQGVNQSGGRNQRPLGERIQDVVNILLFILGAICVIVIVIGGIRYAVSGGDSSQISAAKNTILYAVVGLIVAILAYSIVNFVLGAF